MLTDAWACEFFSSFFRIFLRAPNRVFSKFFLNSEPEPSKAEITSTGDVAGTCRATWGGKLFPFFDHCLLPCQPTSRRPKMATNRREPTPPHILQPPAEEHPSRANCTLAAFPETSLKFYLPNVNSVRMQKMSICFPLAWWPRIQRCGGGFSGVGVGLRGALSECL